MMTELEKVQNGQYLSADEMAAVMTQMMTGALDHKTIKNFLVTLAERGETAEEITGAAKVLRQQARMITAPANAVDCCGTGGDGHHTYNVSTAVSFIVAACGVPLAKHGNRSVSSKAGAADTLEAAGVNLDITPEQTEEALKKFNFAFLMAPKHHQAMKHVAPVRKELARRTIFNLLGPLANPAGTKRQLIGVYDRKWLVPMAETLKALGTECAWIVHGADAMDEITVTGPTYIAKLANGKVTEDVINMADFGLPRHSLADLKGGDAVKNAKALKALLNGEESAYRTIALANAAAVLVIAGQVASLEDGIRLASEKINEGSAADILAKYKTFSQACA